MLALLAFVTGAQAATGMQWQWQDKEHRYFIQTQVKLPSPIQVLADFNYGFRMIEYQVNTVTTCKPERAIGKKAWEVKCTIDDVALRAAPIEQDRPVVDILDQLDDKYTGEGAYILLNVTNDGRVRNVQLMGIDKETRRKSGMQETMRLLITRAFASLDLQLPKKGDDQGKQWQQRGSLSVAFPTDVGTMGLVELVHEVKKTEGTAVKIETSGQGTLGTGQMIAINGQERPANLYEMTFSGSAEFDVKSGMLLSREYVASGTPHASAMVSEGSAGFPYIQAVRVRYVGSHPMKPLGDNEQIGAPPRPTTVNQ